MLERRDTRDISLHPNLALMLSTSGSTGSPKLVRLGHRNVASNAQSIAEYLGLSAAERPITSLPMAYSYGLSIINSHLAVGATLVLTSRGVLEKDFWSAMAEYECTSFAGVPYTYQMLLRVGLLKKSLPSLRTLTQAGGRLDPSYIEQVRTIASERGWSFYVMYGQTEASPRISYVPPAELHRKVGSIGIPVPGGSLEVDPDGELVYSGPNVMLGYAQCEADLCKGDELGGVLKTGDLGRRDEDGFFYVTGRRSRFLKMFGQRFSLDEIENELASRLHSPVACRGSDDHPLGVRRGNRRAGQRGARARVRAVRAPPQRVRGPRAGCDSRASEWKDELSGARGACQTMTAAAELGPYAEAARDKSPRLLRDLNELVRFHVEHCEPYARIVRIMFDDRREVARLSDLPFVPVRLFKLLESRERPT